MRLRVHRVEHEGALSVRRLPRTHEHFRSPSDESWKEFGWDSALLLAFLIYTALERSRIIGLDYVLIVLAHGCCTEVKRRGESSGRSAHMEGLLVTSEEKLSELISNARWDTPKPRHDRSW
jgi:hypothetical protein